MIERTITWNYVSETNVNEIRIYRSTSSGFTPSPSNLITTVAPTITEYVDTVSNELGTYYYIVAMVRDDITVSTGSFKSEPSTQEPPDAITIDKPSLNTPVRDFNIISLTSSGFSSSYPTTHEHSDWVMIETDGEAGYSSLEDTDNLESIEFDIRKTGTYEIRVRHNGTTSYSPWSNPVLYEYEYTGVPVLDIGPIHALEVDSYGNIYAGGTYNKVYKISPAGNMLWEFTGHFETINEIVVDDYGYTYSASSDNTVRKIDPDGNQVWMYGAGSVFNGMSFDGTFLYCTGVGRGIIKIDAQTGQFVSQWDTGANTSAATMNLDSIFVDSTREIVFGAYNYIVKLDRNGTQIWAHRITAPEGSGAARVYDVFVDTSGEVYAISQHIDTSTTYDMLLIKLDSDGNFLWASPESNTLRGYGVSIAVNDPLVYSSTWGVAFGGENYKIYTHNIYTGERPSLAPSFDSANHNENIYKLKFASDGYLYSGCADASIRKYDVETGELVMRIPEIPTPYP